MKYLNLDLIKCLISFIIFIVLISVPVFLSFQTFEPVHLVYSLQRLYAFGVSEANQTYKVTVLGPSEK